MREIVLALVGGMTCAVLATPAAAEMDRYGGAPAASAIVRSRDAALRSDAPRSEAPAGMRVLSWTGKTAAPAPQTVAYAAPALAQEAPAPAARAYRAPANYPPAADDGFTPLYSQAAPQSAPTAPPAQPTSIYAPPPAPAPQSAPRPTAATAPAQAARPQQVAAAAPRNENGPRIYSVHREFGMTPDPIPIAPQFFTATADLSSPPADTGRERRIITGSDGKTTTVMRNSQSASDE